MTDPTTIGAIWRHRTRGTLYQEIARAELQASDSRHPKEGDCLVVYIGTDGRAWARWAPEFEDGRFEKLEPTPPREGPDEALR